MPILLVLIQRICITVNLTFRTALIAMILKRIKLADVFMSAKCLELVAPCFRIAL
jgi:hypothetical protein